MKTDRFNADRQRAFRERIKSQGLKRVQIIIPPECEREVVEFANKLREDWIAKQEVAK